MIRDLFVFFYFSKITIYKRGKWCWKWDLIDKELSAIDVIVPIVVLCMLIKYV